MRRLTLLAPLILATTPVLAQAGAAGPTSSGTGTGKVTPPIGNPGQVFTESSYPAEAKRLHQAGRVVVRLDVDATGRVVDCAVQVSSGSSALDTGTCALAKTVPYRPARDTAGKPVAASVTLPVRWVLPPRRSQDQVVDTTYNDSGVLQSCHEAVDGQALASSAECRLVPTQLPAGALPAGMHTLRLEVWIGYASMPDVPRSSFDGFTIMRRDTLRFHVDRTGQVSACREEDGGAGGSAAARSCGPDVPKRMDPDGEEYDQTVISTAGMKP